ncbi:MAG: biotin transporter BioY [Deferribacteraceae bacterium]|jgi:biotin transport system substrate-specific component|nr:biotin transporter BioY [Deferribacteraceae bacterium]
MTKHNTALIGVFTALIAVSAFIRIPTPIMPLSMQIFMMILTPMLIGARSSFLAILLYIFLGLIGLPVFVSGGGPAYVLQPSFGFLIGYLVSSIPNGLIAAKIGKLWGYYASGMVAIIIIYLFGITVFWLNMNHVQGKEMSLPVSVAVVASPFIVSDLIKLAAAGLIAAKLRKVTSQYRY